MALLRAIAVRYVILFMGTKHFLNGALGKCEGHQSSHSHPHFDRVLFCEWNSLVECALTASHHITGKHPDEMRCEARLCLFIAAGRRLVSMTLRMLLYQRDLYSQSSTTKIKLELERLTFTVTVLGN